MFTVATNIAVTFDVNAMIAFDMQQDIAPFNSGSFNLTGDDIGI